MQRFNIQDFMRGWFIGDFEPTILKTSEFEVGVLTHEKDEHWPAHYHKIATEYNLVIEGKMIIDGITMVPGDGFVIYPREISKPIFLEDTKILVIKVPSVPGDKYFPKEDKS